MSAGFQHAVAIGLPHHLHKFVHLLVHRAEVLAQPELSIQIKGLQLCKPCCPSDAMAKRRVSLVRRDDVCLDTSPLN
jgi:hypothetical protein